ncbi:MAG: hypothetical protein HC884_11960 [Chloroflexaceae bacterium]|nr:hypothetical protein [Chloroflexaceae bacterium]
MPGLPRDKNQNSPRLAIRADGSSSIGTGHVMRCLALAQAWQDRGGRVVFAMAETTPALRERLEAENIPVVCFSAVTGSQEDAQRTLSLARQVEAGWVVADGYHFGAAYQQVVKEAGLRLLLVDRNGGAGNHLLQRVVSCAAVLLSVVNPERVCYTVSQGTLLMERQQLCTCTSEHCWFW